MADGSGSSGVRMMRSIALLRTWSRAKTQSISITFSPHRQSSRAHFRPVLAVAARLLSLQRLKSF